MTVALILAAVVAAAAVVVVAWPFVRDPTPGTDVVGSRVRRSARGSSWPRRATVRSPPCRSSRPIIGRTG